MNLDALPPLRESLAAAGLMAKKSFGQHFLLDLNVTRKIAREAGPLEGTVVIEVGPGPGGLTRALLEGGAAHVIAVEKDPRFVEHLAELAALADGRLTVVEADALDADEAALIAAHAPDLPARIVANLPYNVATPLLVKWLTGPFRPASMTLMFQREVADRIAAPAGASAYGRLSVLAQALAETSVVMKLPARAFTPPPKVDSAVVRLDPRQDRPSDDLIRRLEDVTRAAFGQRRKMLRSSLKPIGGENLLRAAGVDPDARAETIPIEGFLRLAQALPGA
ncbi:MAG: 16S rRNA (adenine(1518)-N(6)/adenine(1519)-N(6))-dimethyltransferase RsmA [Caulobacteraceae bacterium]